MSLMPLSEPIEPAVTPAVEWVTLGLFFACLAAWGLGVWVVTLWSWPGAMVLVMLALVLHASLSHEVLHGHPFAVRRAGEALVIINPGLFVPYLRFRDTHLAHHYDAQLTDPYDDPETNYLDPAVWAQLSKAMRMILSANNTLAGRILLGPVISQVGFMRSDYKAIRRGDMQVLRGWLVHLPGVMLILGLVWAAPMPLWLT